jgi:hypothetical protein
LTAVVDVVAVPDKDPWKVVAVILLSPIVIPEPVESKVPPEEALLRTVPTKYLVAVTASVTTDADEVAVPTESVLWPTQIGAPVLADCKIEPAVPTADKAKADAVL